MTLLRGMTLNSPDLAYFSFSFGGRLYITQARIKHVILLLQCWDDRHPLPQLVFNLVVQSETRENSGLLHIT